MIWSFWDQSLFVFQNSVRTVKYFLLLRLFFSWSLSQSVFFPPSSPPYLYLSLFGSFSLLVPVFVGLYWELYSQCLEWEGGLCLFRVSDFLAPPYSQALFLIVVLSQSLLLTLSLDLPAPLQCFSSFAFFCACLYVPLPVSFSPSPRVGLSLLLHSPLFVFSS